MRCLACNNNLSDKEGNRKFMNWKEIKNPEERYIGLCNGCLVDTDIVTADGPIDVDSFEENHDDFSTS